MKIIFQLRCSCRGTSTERYFEAANSWKLTKMAKITTWTEYRRTTFRRSDGKRLRGGSPRRDFPRNEFFDYTPFVISRFYDHPRHERRSGVVKSIEEKEEGNRFFHRECTTSAIGARSLARLVSRVFSKDIRLLAVRVAASSREDESRLTPHAVNVVGHESLFSRRRHRKSHRSAFVAPSHQVRSKEPWIVDRMRALTQIQFDVQSNWKVFRRIAVNVAPRRTNKIGMHKCMEWIGMFFVIFDAWFGKLECRWKVLLGRLRG